MIKVFFKEEYNVILFVNIFLIYLLKDKLLSVKQLKDRHNFSFSICHFRKILSLF